MILTEDRMGLIPRTSKLNISYKEQLSKRQTLTGDSSIRQDIYTIIKHLNQKHVLNNYKKLTKKQKEDLQGTFLVSNRQRICPRSIITCRILFFSN